MNRNIITIGLSAEMNNYFASSFAIEQHFIIICGKLTEARRRLGNESMCLIVYNAPIPSPREAREAVNSLRQLSYAPIMVLTADEVEESVLENGADCCLPLNSSPVRVLAYAKALVRRYTLYNHYDIAEPDISVLYRGELIIDPLRHRVTLAGEEITLQRREFRLLLYFARNPGIVLTADNISAEVWMSEDNYTHNVTVAIAELRRKLKGDKSNPTYIQTVHGVGYRFLPYD